jgi:HD-GYP domain-containing protein (c-di-GMP phosphodiesterase class II)
METVELNLQRELFVSLYATRLKELRDTPFARLGMRQLEQIAGRRLEAVERALEGDLSRLERDLQQTALMRDEETFKAHHVVMALDEFRQVAKTVLWRGYEEFEKADDVLHWAVTSYVRFHEEVMTEQGMLRVVESLSLALEAKEKYTSSHSQSVQKIGEKIAKTLGVDIGLAGLFHDIGKIHVPDAILTKSSRLTSDEMTLVKCHPFHSFRIISSLYPEAASLCLRHHERPDGRGYPQGETNIPVEANVVAAADTLHAICSDRAYHRHSKLDIALDEIRKGRGTQFLPEVVTAVERAYGDMADLLAEMSAATEMTAPSASSIPDDARIAAASLETMAGGLSC